MPRAASRRRDREKRHADQGSAQGQSAARPRPGGGGATPAPDPFPPQLRPRKGLFVALCAALLVWLGFMLVLYFTTIYPNRAEDILR